MSGLVIKEEELAALSSALHWAFSSHNPRLDDYSVTWKAILERITFLRCDGCNKKIKDARYLMIDKYSYLAQIKFSFCGFECLKLWMEK